MHLRSSPTGELTAARESAAAAASSAAAAASAHAATKSERSFDALLAHASSVPSPSSAPTVSTGTGAVDTTASAPATPAAIALRTGETMTAVDGHKYGEIHGGKRDGMFVNTSSNPRRGKAFEIVTKDGRELHVYGSGKDKLIVRVSPPRDPGNPPAPIKLRDGETMTPVPGHHYALIQGGSRDGMFVNTSLNHNRGKAFVSVTKDGVDYHVYGAGKDRRVVRVVPHDPGAIISSPSTSS
ncbi:MAG TPA: hypothetical protein VH276_02125 [Solirubrobacteraceae bacterium]|nr:hypothetical protein [Solirubrobacteraceae bacterium]